uniref:ER lumen protein-retaining receptor n=1 Tax=Steinernema glaseri TaxID=37863 RepID=A0A1I7ZUY7_9BILA
MNLFRLCGDLSHLFAILILLLKIWKTRSCVGISAKSQVLFALVFLTRYLDLLTTFISVYNSVMKVFFIVSSLATIYFMFIKFRPTYQRDQDTFRIEILVIPAALLALLINNQFTPMEVLWTFSIYLEAVAILPQLFMLQRTGEAETITAHYLFALGSYRALYLLNWVYRYYMEEFFDPFAVVAGVIQTVLYADFFYIYVTRVVKQGGKLELPI